MVIERGNNISSKSRSTKNSNKPPYSNPNGTPDSAGTSIASSVQAATQGFHLTDAVQEQLIQAVTQAVNTALAEQFQSFRQIIREQASIINDLQQYTRLNSVRIYGVPEPASGTKEDTDAVVRDVFKNQLQVDVSPTEICRSHRLPTAAKSPAGERLPRPIIVKFTTYNARRRVFIQKKKT